METKVCNKCNKEKPIDRFYEKTHPSGSKHRLNQCQDCINKAHVEYRKNPIQKQKKKEWSAQYFQKTKDQQREKGKQWRHTHPELDLLIKARNRSKTKGLEYNLTVEDVVIPEFCPILGIKLERNLNGNGPIMSSPTLDRIDNNKGYVKGNVRIISFRANALKNDATVEEMRLILKDMEDNE